MKKILLMTVAVSVLTAVSVWAAGDQPQPRQPGYSGYSDHMGPGMMGSGSGYHGRGSGMMGYDGHMGRGMGPGREGWQQMTPEQQQKWRQMRSDFLKDTLPLRQELSAKQMELEVLWDQPNPDTGKINDISDRVTELRSKLDQKYNRYLSSCRSEFGDLGWACPGGGWRGN